MKKINIVVSKKDLKYILQGLLFSSSVDVIANWDKKDYVNFIKTAKHISKFIPDINKIDLSNIHIEKKSIHEEPVLVKKILKIFKIKK